MTSELQQYYEALGAAGNTSARAVGYRSERSWRAIRAALRRLMPPDLRGARVLDVGCGHGAMVRAWTARNEVIGVDLADSLLRLARVNGLVPVQADGIHLPFASRTFDVVLAIEVLPHMKDAEGLFDSLSRVTRPGGTIIVGTPNGRSVVRRISHALIDMKLVPRGTPNHILLPVLRSSEEILALASRFQLELSGIATTHYPLMNVRLHRSIHAGRSLAASNILFKLQNRSARPLRD